MKTKILKSSLLALAGAVALAAAGSASAMSPPYAMCSFKGQSTLTLPGGGASVTCWTTLTAKADCDGNVEIVAVGAVPDDTAPDPNCYGLYTGNLPWYTDAADILAGTATIDTLHGTGLGSVIDPSGNVLGAGTLNGVGPATGMAVTCDDSPSTTVNVPVSVPVNGTFSATGASFVTTTSLDNKGCVFVP